MTEGTSRVTGYGYDLNGNIVQKVLPNKDTETAAFDAANRAMLQTGTSGAGQPLYQYAYGHDLAGNVTSVAETYGQGDLSNRTVTNIYDAANRLLTEAVSGATPVTTAYAYDDGNNRLSKTVTGGTGAGTTGYQYNALNQLTSYSTGARSVTLGYDANGNRVSRTITGSADAGTDTYDYDFENRLVRIVKGTGGSGSGTYLYGYDYRTRRVVRDETGAGGTAGKVVFSGGTSIIEFAGESTTPDVEYVRGSDYGGGVGGILYTMRGGVPSFTHENRRGDVVAKTDNGGAITYQAAYEAFGTRTQEFGSTPDRQKANTKDEDPTGLLNEGFRYRDLETGCFITKDPIGNMLMMPKEKWMVDGREVSYQEYEAALEPGVPQAGNGPSKTAKDSGQEADVHVAVGAGEKTIPGQKNHWHTAAAGFPNLYTYVNENPWTFWDPEGLDWIGYNGTQVTWYGGKAGDTSKPMHQYAATSGYKGFQDTSKQHVEYGPVPEGKYSVNLKPNPNRVAEVNPKDHEIYANHGMQVIPHNDPNYPQGGWGDNRARLEPGRNTDTTGRKPNFYLHDSAKGYTHGCVETSADLFKQLRSYRAAGNKSIEVRVKYKGTSTYGGTDKP